MGLKSVTTVQGVSVTPHSSFILDWAMHTTGGIVVASSILNQTASYLAHSVAKSCTLIVIYIEFNNNNNNKRPLTPKSMPPACDEHAKLKT